MSNWGDAAQDPEQANMAIAFRVLYERIEAFEQHMAEFRGHVALRKGHFVDFAQHDEQSLRLLTQIQRDLRFLIKPIPNSPPNSPTEGMQSDPQPTPEEKKDDQKARGQGTSVPSSGPVEVSITCPKCKKPLKVTLTAV
jgi:hypothetical protein